ncbi:MAG: UDP-glucose 4-epimerase, partial [Bacteroidetes bacterium]|nr:UDP-glucose 4-epimerase [Bacteroidota bacterium]
EEMQRAEDMGAFFRIPADNRNLNYNLYFSEGETKLSRSEDYHSHNTQRLDVEGMKLLLLKQPYIQREVLGDLTAAQYPS